MSNSLCGGCGQWIQYGVIHQCPSISGMPQRSIETQQILYLGDPAMLDELRQIRQLLEKLLTKGTE